jgi:hypothetical protein
MEVEQWMTEMSNHLHPPAGQARSWPGWKVLAVVSVFALFTGSIFVAARLSEPTALTEQTTTPVASTEPVTVADPRTLAFQTRLDQSLQTMLDSVLGPGISVVTTTATLDFVQVDPAVSDSAASDGVLPPDNIQVPDGSNSAAAGQDETGETIGNAVNKTDEVRSSAPGVVKRLVIVVRMNIAVASAADPAQVEQLVGAAAGIDPDRGDSVTVLT